jgi:hypothetical protein
MASNCCQEATTSQSVFGLGNQVRMSRAETVSNLVTFVLRKICTAIFQKMPVSYQAYLLSRVGLA